MKLKFYLVYILISCNLLTFASHIVGGDFKITMTTNVGSGAYYNFQLKLFRDHINANVAATMPLSAEIGIYDAVSHSQVTTLMLNRTGLSFVPLGDPCYTPDPNVVTIEEGIFTNGFSLLLPNNANGYYVQYENFARNAIITNILNPSNTGITIFAMFPDPSLGQNSSPDFGVYPADAYFCVNNTKVFNFPVTDPDGDSLVYSLVTPLNGTINGGGTSAGSGSYPFYTECIWSNAPPPGAPYSITNIIGGNPPMTIDPITGEIMASPSIQSFFVFCVRVEEYRNGTKIGEVRRDVQYASLGCQVANPPQISVNSGSANSSNVIEIDAYVDENICFDVEVSVLNSNSTDTIYLQMNSSNFDLLNTYVSPISLGTNSSAYLNWENIPGDTNTFSTPQLGANGYLSSIGQIPLRYCWEPLCEELNDTLNINISSYTVTCAGIILEDNELIVYVKNNPQPINLNIPSSMTLALDSVICLNLYALDSSYVYDSTYDDTLYLIPTTSSGFDFSGTYIPPSLGSNGTYFYDNFSYVDVYNNLHEDVTIDMNSFTNINGTVSAAGHVALKYCWTVDCDDVFEEELELNYTAFSTLCGSDTVIASSVIQIEPPSGSSEPTPNVFTPNLDGENDLFHLIGKPDPCYDFMDLKIYNRWGKTVYESTSSEFEWDGNDPDGNFCAEGAYLVIINGSYGSSYENGIRIPNIIKEQVWVQLIR